MKTSCQQARLALRGRLDPHRSIRVVVFRWSKWRVLLLASHTRAWQCTLQCEVSDSLLLPRSVRRSMFHLWLHIFAIGLPFGWRSQVRIIAYFGFVAVKQTPDSLVHVKQVACRVRRSAACKELARPLCT